MIVLRCISSFISSSSLGQTEEETSVKGYCDVGIETGEYFHLTKQPQDQLQGDKKITEDTTSKLYCKNPFKEIFL